MDVGFVSIVDERVMEDGGESVRAIVSAESVSLTLRET